VILSEGAKDFNAIKFFAKKEDFKGSLEEGMTVNIIGY
jgi:hypothetical protein